MKDLITRWTCTRCGALQERRGDLPLPLAWRAVVFHLHQTNRAFDLCPGCVRSLERWLRNGAAA